MTLTAAQQAPARLIADRRAAVESALTASMDRLSAAPPRLVEAMRYSLLGGGKRLRPVLVLLACEAAGGTVAAGMPAACAVEMVHTYSLIHDDLPAMDDDDLRRGQPTCHVRFGEAAAILAGDALLTYAFELVGGVDPPERAAVMVTELARGAGAAGMVGGQTLDLAAEADPSGLTAGDLEGIHRLKTGALFRACLRMGSAAGGGGPELTGRLDRFARCYGLAFQITDDLLDVAGDRAAAGKGVNKDAARGKLTYPGLLGVEESRARARSLCREAVEAVSGLGAPGEALRYLADGLLDRDR